MPRLTYPLLVDQVKAVTGHRKFRAEVRSFIDDMVREACGLGGWWWRLAMAMEACGLEGGVEHLAMAMEACGLEGGVDRLAMLLLSLPSLSCQPCLPPSPSPPQLVKEKQQQPQTVPYAIGIGTETFMFCISFAVRKGGERGLRVPLVGILCLWQVITGGVDHRHP